MSGRLLVVDASVVVEVLRRSEHRDALATTMRGTTLAAPGNLDAEVLSALDRLVRLPIERYPIAPLVRRAWALRENIALRDGLYVACAEALTATLLTFDGRLARSAHVAVKTFPSTCHVVRGITDDPRSTGRLRFSVGVSLPCARCQADS